MLSYCTEYLVGNKQIKATWGGLYFHCNLESMSHMNTHVQYIGSCTSLLLGAQLRLHRVVLAEIHTADHYQSSQVANNRAVYSCCFCVHLTVAANSDSSAASWILLTMTGICSRKCSCLRMSTHRWRMNDCAHMRYGSRFTVIPHALLSLWILRLALIVSTRSYS